ncbi:UNVERIFIED_CONTAM: hypothetical protein GTU68_039599 [Idotea baltica]|nr:hypothetical protein [Idotea baltica]
MVNIDLINSRIIRILGNLVKGISIAFHKIFPNKRFTIPEYSAPLIKSKKQTAIPKIIWQTNFTNQVSLPIYVNYLFNRVIAPSYEYRFILDIDQYIKDNYSYAFDAYSKLTVGASKADLWRLLALHEHGGIYIDMDGCLVAKPSKILKGKTEMFIKAKQLYITNYYFAVAPNNEKIKQCINTIITNIESGDTSLGVWNLTGPGVMDKIMNDENTTWRYARETCIQGAFTNEYFQYIDKSEGKWTRVKNDDILKN